MASPRRVCWLLLGPEDTRTNAERADLARLAAVCPQITAATALVGAFAQVFQQRKVDDLHAWLARAEESGIGEFAAVARSIWTDRRAVEAAVRLEWSNGQVEGHVNRLKLIKRTMYGRANVDLLRQRVLPVV
jgi:transposase